MDAAGDGRQANNRKTGSHKNGVGYRCKFWGAYKSHDQLVTASAECCGISGQ